MLGEDRERGAADGDRKRGVRRRDREVYEGLTRYLSVFLLHMFSWGKETFCGVSQGKDWLWKTALSKKNPNA